MESIRGAMNDLSITSNEGNDDVPEQQPTSPSFEEYKERLQKMEESLTNTIWIKEELRNMFTTDAYAKLLYDMLLDSDQFSTMVDVTSSRRMVFFIFRDFERLFAWAQTQPSITYDPVDVRVFDLSTAEKTMNVPPGSFLDTINSAINAPKSVCVCISVESDDGEGFRTLYSATYSGKETSKYRRRRLKHYGTKCNLTFNYVPNVVKSSKRDEDRFCHACARIDVPLFRCIACKDVMYCSPECQRLDWTFHKKTCVKKQ